ncbi:MAG: nicotinate-nucleotide--dimethylbenzimidazole phosphoribosyltransferase [Proteobacteria bacterium]|nr:nicotinate-nucleotide--dimethylbenzimidazole phosphoribosyltransferase [Pseudomonadota bacterium]
MATDDPLSSLETLTSFDEVRALVRALPGPGDEARAKARAREATLTKPAGALGRLEALTEWLCAWQGRHPPSLDHPRVSVFAGNHGVAARGVSAYPAEVTAQMVANFINGGAAVNQLCRVMEADFKVYEMALEEPTRDFTEAPAMDEAACVRAMSYGMMTVEAGIDVLCLGEMGIGNTTSAAALSLALFGGEAADWVGPGTGVSGEVLARKTEVVAAGVKRHQEALIDPLAVMRCLGGQELAAIAGAVIAARLARTPVLLDGYAACAAAAVLHQLDPGLLDHCQAAHRSAEPGHARLLDAIGKRPILELDMRLGEATGAVLALGVLKGAVACHTGMASFGSANVSGKRDG